MSIFIDKEKCKKCGKCAAVCPGSLIGKNPDGTACMRYPKDCWGCSSCIKECKFGAIALYLGADIGGMGSKMTVNAEDGKLYWNIESEIMIRSKMQLLHSGNCAIVDMIR